MNCYPSWLQYIIAAPIIIMITIVAAIAIVGPPCMIWLSYRDKNWSYVCIWISIEWIVLSVVAYALCQFRII